MILVFGMAGLLHASIYLALLGAFGMSLLPGREPIVTYLARLERGTLDTTLIIYTRRVTLLWCGFFIVELVLSPLLFLYGPHAVWLTFVSAMNLPLVIFVFLIEYVYRRIRLRHYTHDSLIETIRLARNIKAVAFKRSA